MNSSKSSNAIASEEENKREIGRKSHQWPRQNSIERKVAGSEPSSLCVPLVSLTFLNFCLLLFIRSHG